MIESTRSKFQSLEESGPNSNVCNDKVRITLFIWKRSKLQRLKGEGENKNVSKENV